MAESESAPRKTTTYRDFEGMASQNERYNVKPNEMFFLENIMRIAPHKLHSVRGPGFPFHFPAATICTDSTERGQQSLTIDIAFDQENARPTGNNRTSWGFINNGEIYTLEGTATCEGGNMGYDNVCCQINHYINDNPVVSQILPLPIVDPFAPFVNSRLGVSDQTCWAANSNAFGGIRVYYNIGANFVDYHTPSNNGGGHGVSAFAIKGNELWCFVPSHLDVGPAVCEVTVFDRALGTLLHDYPVYGTADRAVSNMQLTTNFCYVLSTDGTFTTVDKIDRSTGMIVSSFDVTNILAQFVAVQSDNLIYLVCSGGTTAVYYLSNFTDLVYVGKTTGQGFTPFAFGTGIFNNGTIYFGSNGFAGFNTDIRKIIIACPPTTPVVASITVSESTVAAGGTVHFDFGPILLPDATDRVALMAASSSVFVGTQFAIQSTGGVASGTSVAFTIPGGTTPGSYKLVLCTQLGSILIANSNTFTVT